MSDATPMPREEGFDQTLSMLREGYMYISNRRKGFESDVFETRLLGEKAVCLSGEEGARLFYDEDKFKRAGAAPRRLEKTLFGEGGVQGLDGEAHRHRKAMFMEVMNRSALERLRALTGHYWDEMAAKWEEQDQVVLYDASQELLFRVATDFAGVPSAEEHVERRAEAISNLFQSAASIGPQHWRGRRSRDKMEQWIEALVTLVRRGELDADEDKTLHRFSMHRDLDGNLLDANIVAVEILNILRPMMAISVYISFMGLALHNYPDQARKLTSGSPEALHHFVQEVRRFYPFFPFAAARVKRDFSWKGMAFEADTLALLDLYGTNHDPRSWENPELFNPERFASWNQSPFNFIPQGGGDHFMGHRCAGEWATVAIMEESLDYLVNRLRYEVPEQDLSYSLVSAPSTPASGMVIEQVRRVTA
jgi:fatty-acid peroxygenase